MKLSNVYIICIILFAFIMQSCSKMNDLHQKYLNNGEIIYAAKVDSVTPGTGRNRIQLGIAVSAQRIQSVRVFWNDYTDSTDVTIGSTGVFKKILTNMVEKSYIFECVSIDKFGNKSLPFEVTGKVYGDVYESARNTRPCKIVSSNVGLVLQFFSSDKDNVSTEVTYTNTSGILTTISVPPTVNSYVIADNKTGSQITLKSSYMPVNGIDTFYGPVVNIATGFFELDKKDWKIDSYSDRLDASNGPNNIIDGIPEATRWHTNGSAYPHWAIIDMGAVRTIKQFGVWVTTMAVVGADTRAPIKIQFLISMDKITWTDLGSFDFNNLITGEHVYPMPTLPTGRYFKFVGLAGQPGNNQYMTLGEISAYGS